MNRKDAKDAKKELGVLCALGGEKKMHRKDAKNAKKELGVLCALGGEK